MDFGAPAPTMEYDPKDTPGFTPADQMPTVWGAFWGSIHSNSHTALDVAGMLPIVGIPADALNAVIYFAEGDATNGLMSMTSMVPIVGDAVGAAKLAGKAVKTEKAIANGSSAAKAIDKIPGANNMVKKTDDVIQSGQGGLNLFKWGQPQTKLDGWKSGDRTLYLPYQGSPKADWKQNAGRLREEMKKGEPIFDTFIDPVTGIQKQTEIKGFIDMERHLLESRGWKYNPSTGAYYPPQSVKAQL